MICFCHKLQYKTIETLPTINFPSRKPEWDTERDTEFEVLLNSLYSGVRYCGVPYSGKRSPPFKMVVLDEADSMTASAQVCMSVHILVCDVSLYLCRLLYDEPWSGSPRTHGFV